MLVAEGADVTLKVQEVSGFNLAAWHVVVFVTGCVALGGGLQLASSGSPLPLLLLPGVVRGHVGVFMAGLLQVGLHVLPVGLVKVVLSHSESLFNSVMGCNLFPRTVSFFKL